GDRFLDRRFALAEAARVYRLMRDEGEARIAEIARGEFDWDLRPVRRELDGQVYSFELHFEDYLRNASSFREDKWKLVNRMMREGYVLVTRGEAIRLIQEEVEDLIRRRVSKHGKIPLPEPVQARVDRIAKLFEENRATISGEELPAEARNEAFPPCMRHAFEGLMSGRRASHMERFALTSFLVNVGMDLERIVQLFVSVTDFDEQLTRYQIEHIAGLRGSRTKYTPPNCDTLRTHGVCHSPDSLCGRIRHPLSYYRTKARGLRRGEGESEPRGE
ncbi:MAG: DNA primase regulatory subunit PriL, partial [Candidatus Bathyarchaeia archaeon]